VSSSLKHSDGHLIAMVSILGGVARFDSLSAVCRVIATHCDFTKVEV